MMKAGRYYVGDLCYVMHNEWDEFCDITIKGNECLDGEFELKDGRRFATYGTLYGDGSYRSDFGTYHSVDAGLIGCIRLEDISEDISEEEMNRLGAVIDFPEEFETGSDSEGNIFFGYMTIATGDSDDGYDDESDDGYALASAGYGTDEDYGYYGEE
jgi:hypothetical protein